MYDLGLKGRLSRHIAVARGSSLSLFGGGSAVASGGGFIAQVTGHASIAASLGIYGSAALIALVGGVTAIVKIVAERSPEIRKATALAKIAKKRSGEGGARILLIDRSLDKQGITAAHALKMLDQLAAIEENHRNTNGAVKSLKPSETDQNVVSIYKDEEGRARNVTDLVRPNRPGRRPMALLARS